MCSTTMQLIILFLPTESSSRDESSRHVDRFVPRWGEHDAGRDQIIEGPGYLQPLLRIQPLSSQTQRPGRYHPIYGK